MSRTDKDEPLWVRAEWWVSRHLCADYSSGMLPCDLTDLDVEKYRTHRIGDNGIVCYWKPVEDKIFSPRRYHRRSPPGWYTHHRWWNPQRVLERDVLLDAKKDWNSNGDTDIEVENCNPHNSAQHSWW